ncbi:hypothetical protein D3C80_1505650 [compost metagenome]
MTDRGVRHFQLADDHVRLLQHRIETTEHRRRQCAVGPGDDHDGVLAVVVDHDQRHATGALHGADSPTIDALVQQRLAQHLAIGIAAHAAHHRHLRAEARGRHSLVRALAATDGRKRLADQCFSTTGQARRPGHQVHVQAADYHYFC